MALTPRLNAQLTLPGDATQAQADAIVAQVEAQLAARASLRAEVAATARADGAWRVEVDAVLPASGERDSLRDWLAARLGTLVADALVRGRVSVHECSHARGETGAALGNCREHAGSAYAEVVSA